MISEFESRHEIEKIQSSLDAPLAKARKLLFLKRKIQRGRGNLAADQNEQFHILERLEEDVRVAAYEALHQPTGIGFDHTPTPRAYPQAWQETGGRLREQA